VLAVSPKKLTNFRIDSELLEGLATIRDRDHIPVSAQVRLAIQDWLKKKGVNSRTALHRARTRRKV
jgi:hypothetical protein